MIARKSALIITTHITNALLSYIALFFVTRFMEPADYGIVAFALGFVTLYTIFGTLGFDQAHIKRISEGKDLGRCIGTFLSTKIGLIALMIFVVLGSIFFWKFILERGFESPTHELAIYVMIVYWVVRLLTQSFISTFNAKREIAKSKIPDFLFTLIRVIATIYVAIAGFGALELAATYIVGEIAHLISALYFFRGYPIKKPSRDYLKDYSIFAFPLIVVVASHTIMTNIDKVFIQLFWSASDVGYYFAAFNLSRFVHMFTLALGLLLFPTFSVLHINKDIKGIRKLTYKSERYLSMIVFPMVFGLIVLAEPAARILLSGWMPVVPILQILPFFALFGALGKPYGTQILGMNQPKLARNRVLIMVFCNIILNIILVPKDIQMLNVSLFGLGAKGAAIATVVSYGVTLAYNRIIAWKLTKVKGNPRIFLHAIAASTMALILYLILYEFNMVEQIQRWYELLGFSLIGLGIYIGILILFKEFTSKDYHFFVDTINIKKMFQYIKEEIRGK